MLGKHGKDQDDLVTDSGQDSQDDDQSDAINGTLQKMDWKTSSLGKQSSGMNSAGGGQARQSIMRRRSTADRENEEISLEYFYEEPLHKDSYDVQMIKDLF